MRIFINNEEHEVDGSMISYEEIVSMAMKGLTAQATAHNVTIHYTITIGQSRAVVPAERIYPEPDMRFVVARQ